MLSTKENITSELRRIAPTLNEIATVVRKGGLASHDDMLVFGRLVDLAKEEILTEYRIESQLEQMVVIIKSPGDMIPELERFAFFDKNEVYGKFIVTLKEAVLGVRTSEDLTYIKSKYYPIFDKGYDPDFDYGTMILDLGRLSISAKAVKASRVEITVEPWYKRWFPWAFRQTSTTTERQVDARGAL